MSADQRTYSAPGRGRITSSRDIKKLTTLGEMGEINPKSPPPRIAKRDPPQDVRSVRRGLIDIDQIAIRSPTLQSGGRCSDGISHLARNIEPGASIKEPINREGVGTRALK